MSCRCLWLCRAGDARSLYAFVKFYSSQAAARALHCSVGRLYIGGQHLKVCLHLQQWLCSSCHFVNYSHDVLQHIKFCVHMGNVGVIILGENIVRTSMQNLDKMQCFADN